MLLHKYTSHFLLLFAFYSCSPANAVDESHLALIVCNVERHPTMKRDCACDIAEPLRQAGFRVVPWSNQTPEEFAAGAKAFFAEAPTYPIVFVYFRGFAIGYGKDLYLTSVAAAPKTLSGLYNDSLRLGFLVGKLESRRSAKSPFATIVMVDSIEPNPLHSEFRKSLRSSEASKLTKGIGLRLNCRPRDSTVIRVSPVSTESPKSEIVELVVRELILRAKASATLEMISEVNDGLRIKLKEREGKVAKIEPSQKGSQAEACAKPQFDVASEGLRELPDSIHCGEFVSARSCETHSECVWVRLPAQKRCGSGISPSARGVIFKLWGCETLPASSVCKARR